NSPTLLTLSTAIPATSGVLSKTGPGALDLTAANLHTGGTILNAGTLGVGNNSCFNTSGTLDINGGKLANDSGTARSVPAAVAVNINGDFAFDDSIFTTSANGNVTFGGSATLKNGNRTISVNKPNNFTGTLILNGVIG